MTRHKSRVFDDAPLVSRKEAEEQGLRRYFTGDLCKNGHRAPRYVVSGACVNCSADKALAWEKRAYFFTPEHMKSKAKSRRLLNPAETMFRGVRSRALKRGVEFSIKVEDISIPDKCPCCDRGLKMGSGEGAKGPTNESPSLDRVNPLKGYVPGNVMVICWRCNNLKRDATVDELRKIVKWMEQNIHPNLRLVS